MNEAGPFVAPANAQLLAHAWHAARDGSVAVIAAVIVGLGYLIPLGLLALAGWLGWRGAGSSGAGEPPPPPLPDARSAVYAFRAAGDSSVG